MKKNLKNRFKFISAVLTTLILYLSVRLWLLDGTYTVIPGWHTTLLPADIAGVWLTTAILFSSLVVWMLFRGIFKLLMWLRKGQDTAD